MRYYRWPMCRQAFKSIRFSNRPVGVKHFQALHDGGVDVAHGLVLLFEIGTRGPSIMGFEELVTVTSPVIMRASSRVSDCRRSRKSIRDMDTAWSRIKLA